MAKSIKVTENSFKENIMESPSMHNSVSFDDNSSGSFSQTQNNNSANFLKDEFFKSKIQEKHKNYEKRKRKSHKSGKYPDY